MAGFGQQVRAMSERTKERLDAAVRKIALGAFTEVILMSPVGNPDLWESPPPPGYVGGRFRGNWQVAIGTVPTGTLQLIDPEGTATISRAQAEVMNLQGGQNIFLVNNLPYARALEYGHSSQAPNGMVRLTVQRWQPIADKVAQELRGGA